MRTFWLLFAFLILQTYFQISNEQYTPQITLGVVENLNFKENFILYRYVVISKFQISATLALNFMSLDSMSTPEIKVEVGLKENNYTLKTCDNNQKKKIFSCFYPIPQEIEEINIWKIFVKITCLALQCDLFMRSLVLSNSAFFFDHTEFLYIRDNTRCELRGLNLTNLKNKPQRMVLSMHSHNTEAYNVLQTPNLFTFINVVSNLEEPRWIFLADKIVLIFNKTLIESCGDCMINLLFCSQKEIIFEINAQNYQELITEVSLDTGYVDYLDINEAALSRRYHLKLSDDHQLNVSQNRLYFMLNTLSGPSKTLYLNLDYEPNKPKDFTYNSTLLDFYQEEDIIITQEDITLANSKGRDFYILVMSSQSGLFKLEIKETNNLITSISIGVAETRSIKADELHYYKLLLWRSGKDDGYLEIKATVESGNIEIFARKCSGDADCPLITMDEINNSSGKIDYISDNSKQGNKKLRMISKCETYGAYCNVLIAIKGFNSTFLGINRYTLLVNRESTIISLIENQRHDSHIDLNDIIRYSFSVNDENSSIQSIKFRISADLPFFSSKNTQCFEFHCAEKRGNILEPIYYKSENSSTLSGIYYLFVDGIKSTDFSIYPEVTRKDSPHKEIKLSEGKIFTGVLDKENKESWFTFVIESQEEIEFEVIIQGPKQKLEMEVFNGKSTGFGWISNNNVVEIKHLKGNDPLYCLVVRPFNVDIEISKIQFGVFYATGKTLRVLEKNKLFYESLKPKNFKHYMFYVDLSEEVCILNKHIINPVKLAQNCEVFLSNSAYPEEDYYLHKAENAETSRIVLKPDDLNKLCINSTNPHHCPLYVSVYNSGDSEEIIFSLMVQLQNKPVHMIEGYEQRFILNRQEEVLRGYFIPHCKTCPIDFFFYTEDEKFELVISILEDKENKAVTYQYFQNYINKTSHDFYLHENHQQSLVFKPESLEFCWPSCILLFTVTYSLHFHDTTSLAVLISTNYTELFEGKQVVFSLEKSQIKYFYYTLSSFLKNSENTMDSWLLLTMTPYYGEANVFINLVHKLKDQSPTPQSSDYTMYNQHFSIKKSEINRILSRYISNASLLYDEVKLEICVYCPENEGKFMLNMIKSSHLLQSIYPGSPFEVLVQKNEQIYFQYYHGYQESFKLFFNRETGNAFIGIVSCSNDSIAEDSEVFNSCKNKKEMGIKVIAGSGSGVFVVNEKTLIDFCHKCYYLIHLKGEAKGSLILKNEESTFLSLQEGRKFYDHLQKGEESRFIFWTSALQVTEVLVTVFQGDPIIYYSPNYFLKKESFLLYFSKKNSSFINFLIPPKRSPEQEPSRTHEWEIPDTWGQHSTHYLLVSASETSQYSLSFISKGSQILQGGLVHQDSLPPSESKSYIYQKMDNFHGYLTLSFDENEGNFTDYFELSSKFREFQPNQGFDTSEMSEVILIKRYEALKTICFLLPSMTQGTYIFNLTSKSKNFQEYLRIKFWIVVNSMEISMVPFNFTIRSFIPLRNFKIYEAYVPSAGFLAVELMQCYGHLELLMTKDYHKVLLEEFDEEFKPLTGHSFVHIMKLEEEGMVYFALKSGEIMSIFDLSLRFYEHYMDIPQVKFTVDDNKGLKYSYDTNNDEFEVFFGGVSCESCELEQKKNIKIKYYLLTSDNIMGLMAKGQCQVYSLEEKTKEIPGDVNTHSIGLYYLTEKENISKKIKLNTDKPNFVTIKAVVYQENNDNFEIFYGILDIPPGRKHHRLAFYVIMSFIAVLILGCCLASIFFFRRYKKIEKRLKYEMEDVRNVANVTGNNTSIEMENKKYQGLAEENN